jgi:AcrR family transcriptional regulator
MARTTAQPGARKAPRPGPAQRTRGAALTRETIVASALELAERDGAAALSLRRLGEEIGVDATAFYRHFRDKDDLVLAAFDQVVAAQVERLRGRDGSMPWRDRMRALAEDTWDTAQQHPAMFALGFYRTTGGPAEREIVEHLLATIAETGLPPEQVVLHYRMYADAQLSLCGMTAATLALGDALREKDASAWTRIYAVLPQAEYPAARAHSRELAAVDERTIFLGVIDSILDRIEAAIEQHRAASAPHRG